MTNLFSTQAQGSNTELLITRILIVDDQKAVRARIKEVLSTQQNIKVVGVAENGQTAIAMVESLRPDVALVDIEMPGMNGIEVIKILSRQYPKLKTLVISFHDKEEYVQKAVGLGVDGYILKQTSALDLISAIETVHRQGFYLGKGLLKKVQSVSRPNYPEVNLHKSLQQQDASLSARQPDSFPKLDNQRDSPAAIANTNINQLEENLSVVEIEEFLPSIGKWITWGGIAVIIVISLIVPVSSILKYETKVKAPAMIRPKGEVRLVQAKVDGQITEIFAESGDRVQQGYILATIDPFRVKTEQDQTKKAIAQQLLQLAQLESQMATIDRQITAETQRNSSEIRAVEAELRGNRRVYEDTIIATNSQLKEAQAQLKAARAILRARENRVARYKSVATQGALSKEQLAEAELELRQQQQELEIAQAQLNTAMAAQNPSNAEIESVQQQIEQLGKSGLSTMEGLEREKEVLIQQQLEIDRQIAQQELDLDRISQELARTKIQATATGIVSKLDLRNPGQSVAAGQEIAQIVPEGEALAANILVSAEDIGKVETGQEVQIRVSSCAYPDYGVLKGKVDKIAKDITQPKSDSMQADSSTRQSSSNLYKVTVTPEAPSFGRREFQCKLQTGMQGSAEIITREETALQFILRKARLISNV